MRKLLFVILVLLAAGYGIAEVAAKGYAERQIEKRVSERYPPAREVNASVSAPVIFGVLAHSRIDRVEVEMSHLELGEFATDRVSGTLTGVHLKLGESVKQRKMVVASIDRLDVSVEILDSEVSKALPERLAFEFEKGRVILTGSNIRIAGTLEVVPPATLRFRPSGEGLALLGIRFPAWDLSGLPFVNCLKDIRLERGRAKVTCSINNPPADLPPDGTGLF